MKKNPGSPKKTLHIVVGTPDVDNCEICRAHAMENADPVDGGPLGPVLVQELPLDQILRCPCPLCAQARQEEIGG